ncbi:alpha/beta hydrolase [Streptomyces sp. NPDC021749]|uniref:alpha/beta hydrolase n=1 Tax=Streptomyces sp. NPDC021749 TaxID=3154905 RepID=UPI0033CB7CCA
MASDYARLLRQDFADMTAAAISWQRVSRDMDSAFDQHRTKVTGPLHASWEGDDAKAALAFLEDIEMRINVVRTEAMTISKAIDTVRFRMEQAQTDLRNAVRSAESEGFLVDDSGSVGEASCEVDESPDDAQTKLDRMKHFQEEINTAIEDARKASADGHHALSELHGEIMDRTNKHMSAESAADTQEAMKDLGVKGPQIPKDPKDAAAWWKGLDEASRQEYATMYPEQIGKANGLPSSVRDDANRLALDQQLNFVSGSDQAIPGIPENRHNLEVLKAELDKRDGATGNKKLYLLDFNGFEDGKAVIAMGNPDTADNVGVQVPGTATDMNSTGGQLSRIEKLQRSAERADPSANTSMVYWLGYDAPEIPSSDAPNLGVAGTGRADDAAPDLRDFTHGLRASHEGSDRAHMTVLGHSYGATVVGDADAGGKGLDADSISVVGSPGETVGRASDLHVDPHHFYTGIADDDFIKQAQDLTLGPDPNTTDFGGTRFVTDTHGHSGYWDDNSESLANQGRIIAGKQPNQAPPTPIDM